MPVAEVYVRKPTKERKAKQLWSILEQALTGKYDYGLQAKHHNKCRVGLRSVTDLDLFQRTTLLELMASGLVVKDERTQEYVTPYAGEEDHESEASMAESEGGGQEMAAVVYDVPLVYTADEVLRILR